MKRKILLTIPLATLVTLAVADDVSAHNATAAGTCQGGVTWSATNYDKTVTNSITVTIDGTVRHHDPDMKASDAGTIATDKTVGHAWSVVVNAPGTQYDRNLSGSYPACVTVPTTTVPSSTTVAPTTTASPTTSMPDVATTVVDDPTTTVVAVDIPPVPTTVALDVVSLTPAEPVLPRTGLDEFTTGLIVVGIGCLIGGMFLVLRGRRVQ